MKKKAKPAGKKPSVPKSRATKRAASAAGVRPTRNPPGEQAATQDAISAGLAELVMLSADMRELLTEIRDLLAEGREGEAEAESAGEGATVVIAETEGEEFE